MNWYILDDNDNPVIENDMEKFDDFLRSDRLCINKDFLTKDGEKILVSTVFLIIDHNFVHGKLLPLLFETMIFGGDHDGYQERYTTKADALIGHEKAVKMVKGEV